MIYMFELPNGLVKIGRGDYAVRRSCAQQFFLEEVACAALWEAENEVWAEYTAQQACGLYHVGSELFRGATPTLIGLVSGVLGAPIALNVQRRRRGRPRKRETLYDQMAKRCDLV